MQNRVFLLFVCYFSIQTINPSQIFHIPNPPPLTFNSTTIVSKSVKHLRMTSPHITFLEEHLVSTGNIVNKTKEIFQSQTASFKLTVLTTRTLEHISYFHPLLCFLKMFLHTKKPLYSEKWLFSVCKWVPRN